MKKLLLILISPIIINSCTNWPSKIKSVNDLWNAEKRLRYLTNRNDSTTWDQELLENDKQIIGLGDSVPFELGAFPVPNYGLIGKGSFKGVGTLYKEFHLNKKTF